MSSAIFYLNLFVLLHATPVRGSKVPCSYDVRYGSVVGPDLTPLAVINLTHDFWNEEGGRQWQEEECICRCQADPACTQASLYQMEKRCELYADIRLEESDLVSNSFGAFLSNVSCMGPCRACRAPKPVPFNKRERCDFSSAIGLAVLSREEQSLQSRVPHAVRSHVTGCGDGGWQIVVGSTGYINYDLRCDAGIWIFVVDDPKDPHSYKSLNATSVSCHVDDDASKEKDPCNWTMYFR